VTLIPMFGELDLETVASCNRTCPTCLRNSFPNRGAVSRRFGKQERMPEEIFRKVIDEAIAFGFTGWVNLQHFSEPFQDPRIAKLAGYAKDKGVFSRVYMHSNGDLLTKRKAQTVDGVLDVIRIALYDEVGGNPMPEEKAAPRRELISSWFTKTEVQWTGGTHVVTHFSPTPLLPQYVAQVRPLPCRREAQMRMIIDWRGEMLLCCDDIAGLWTLGNVADNTVEELWHSPRHVEVIETLAQPGGREAYGYCRSCPRPDGEWSADWMASSVMSEE